MGQSRSELAEFEGRIVMIKPGGPPQPAAITLQIRAREAVHRHMLRGHCAAVPPRFAIPVGGGGRMIEAGHPFSGEIACERHLPIHVISNGQGMKYWTTKTWFEAGLNVQRAIIKTVELMLIAKHGIQMHLAFDKGKPTP